MELVRRARLAPERKLALLAFGSYANAEGAGIFCGTARLAADCQVSLRTAGRYLTWMRSTGFVELVERGNRRRGKADRYRLILAPDLAERIDLPDPEQYRRIIGELAAANRSESRQRYIATRDRSVSTDTNDDRRSRDVPQTPDSDEEAAPDEGSTDIKVSAETGFSGHEAMVSTDTLGVHPPFIDDLTSEADLPWGKMDLRSPREPSARAGARDDAMSAVATRPPRSGPTCACGVELDPMGRCFRCHR